MRNDGLSALMEALKYSGTMLAQRTQATPQWLMKRRMPKCLSRTKAQVA